MELKITIMNERSFQAAMGKVGSGMRPAIESALTVCAIEFVEKPAAVLATRNFQHPTGNMPTSLYTEISTQELLARIGSDLIYAPLREFGGNVSTPWPTRGPYRVISHTGRLYLTNAFG